MNTTLTVKGMHCQACKTLITMEIEEQGLGQKIKAIEIAENQNQGTVELNDVTAAELTKIKNTINQLPNYQVS